MSQNNQKLIRIMPPASTLENIQAPVLVCVTPEMESENWTIDHLVSNLARHSFISRDSDWIRDFKPENGKSMLKDLAFESIGGKIVATLP